MPTFNCTCYYTTSGALAMCPVHASASGEASTVARLRSERDAARERTKDLDNAHHWCVRSWEIHAPPEEAGVRGSEIVGYWHARAETAESERDAALALLRRAGEVVEPFAKAVKAAPLVDPQINRGLTNLTHPAAHVSVAQFKALAALLAEIRGGEEC